jgi:hypothetical protein
VKWAYLPVLVFLLPTVLAGKSRLKELPFGFKSVVSDKARYCPHILDGISDSGWAWKIE